MDRAKSRAAAAVVSPLPPVIIQRLARVVENARLLQVEVKASAPSACAAPTEEFPAALAQSAAGVSRACTALAVLFSPPAPPTPSPGAPPTLGDCSLLCEGVEQSCVGLAAAFLQRPSPLGMTLLAEVRGAVVAALGSVEVLVTALVQHGRGRDGARLRGAGGVWESCEAVAKVSRDNRAAVLRVCVGQLHLLRDACAEMAELRSQDGRSRPDDFLSEEFGSDEGELVEGVAGVCLDGSVPEGTAEALPGETGAWTEEERRLVKPCMRLIELSADLTEAASRLLVSGGVHGPELDRLAGTVKLLSPLVDDLGDELSAPLAVQQCQGEGGKLAEALLSLVESMSVRPLSGGRGATVDDFKEAITDCLSGIQASS